MVNNRIWVSLLFIFLKSSKLKKLERRTDDILKVLENDEVNKFMDVFSDPRKLFWKSFLLGIAKGVGMAFGFSIIGAFIIYILKELVVFNIPVISEILSDIIKMTEERL